MATTACLLSGLEVFSETYQEQAKYFRVAKGLHGLHIYATEYWTGYFLSHAVSAEGRVTSTILPVFANRLVNKLSMLDERHVKEASKPRKQLESGHLQAHSKF
jgi:hypothetical protein